MASLALRFALISKAMLKPIAAVPPDFDTLKNVIL